MLKVDFQNQFETLPKPNLNRVEGEQKGTSEESVDNIWKIAKELLKLKITTREFSTWYKDFYLVKISNGIAEFACKNSYQKEWILSSHSRLLKTILLDASGQNLEIIVNISEQKKTTTAREKIKYEYIEPKEGKTTDVDPIFMPENNAVEQTKKAIENAQLNPKYQLETFVVGASNRLAHAVAQAIIENPGKSYNPVFFYGKSGVGKTHLMQGIGLEILKKNPSKKIFYCTSEYFLNEVINAIRTGTGEKFRQNYRKLDVLIIDDIQFITNSPKTQEELFHTFNTLYQAQKQFIMASDRPPKEIDGLSDRLKSRFEGGIVCDILTPDYETRMAILINKMNELEVVMPNEYVELIAENIDSSIRELEGAITKIVTTMKLLGSNLTKEDILRILSIDIESKRRKMSPTKVIEIVSEVFDVTIKEIKGKKRTAYIALARQVIMFILRDVLEMPLEKVAKEVNRKDHTTVIHACEKIQELSIKDKRFNEKIEKCKTLLAE